MCAHYCMVDTQCCPGISYDGSVGRVSCGDTFRTLFTFRVSCTEAKPRGRDSPLARCQVSSCKTWTGKGVATEGELVPAADLTFTIDTDAATGQETITVSELKQARRQGALLARPRARRVCAMQRAGMLGLNASSEHSLSDEHRHLHRASCDRQEKRRSLHSLMMR